MPVLKVKKRQEIGSRRVKHLRKQGLIPGIIYGHGLEPQPVTISEHDIELAIQHGDRLLEVDIEGEVQNALVKDVQYDTYGHSVLHVDLARVDLDERVEVTVQIVLKGTPAGVTEQGGMLQQIAAEARVECFVRAIPDEIVVPVGGMKVGDHLNMSDLPLPEGAKLLEDGDAMVASVRIVAEEAAAPAAEAPAEPEIIGEKKEEGEEQEEAD